MEFPDPKINEYAEAFTSAEPVLLAELNRETWSKVIMPRMLSGHIQGRMLSSISKMSRPKRILEIGTYTGYSALCLAEGLTQEGVLHTIDINEELEAMIRKYFSRSEYSEKLVLHIGNAVEIVDSLNEKWDLVFIDADKENYSNYFDLVIDKMNPGGLIIADNVLWSGKVLDEENKMDKETMALHEFNRKVQNDQRVENVLFPIRDGLMIAIVK
jgi:caffeoyl-CoA O-methyltransferase